MSPPMARTPPVDFDVGALGGNHWFDNPLLCLFYLFYRKTRSINQYAPTKAMNMDAGIAIARLYQLNRPNGSVSKMAATPTTVSCPTSTPMLNPISAGMNCPSGKPKSPRTEAKPRPCNRPNPKIITGRHLFSDVVIRFSTATNTMDAAIKGSTIDPEITTISDAPSASVTVCAKVKAEICQIRARHPAPRKKMPKTNRMWSNPLGTM